jgi:DNA-binding NarL/FixJ family response regulator
MQPTAHSQQPIKVIVADDYELLRIAFVNILQKQPFFEVVAEACNGEQLVQQTRQYKPDVVLVDVKMPVMDGIEATRIITAQFPCTLVLGCSLYNNEYLMAEMLGAGAKGFVLKHAHPDELVAAIKSVHNNEYYFCSYSTEKINKLVANKEYDFFTKERKPLLSHREKEILIHICHQKSSKDISGILNISVRTVEDFRSKLLAKTQSKTVAGLVSFAVEQGIYIP